MENPNNERIQEKFEKVGKIESWNKTTNNIVYDSSCNRICFNEDESSINIFKYDHDLFTDNYNHCKTQLKKLSAKVILKYTFVRSLQKYFQKSILFWNNWIVLETVSAAGQAH